MMIMYIVIINIKLYKVEHWYKNAMYYLYNNLIHGFHISNFIFHELSMQLMIELLLTFNKTNPIQNGGGVQKHIPQ